MRYVFCLLVFAMSLPLFGQQAVIVNQFPIGESEVTNDFFEPFKNQFYAQADVLKTYSGAKVVITGKTDGHEYTAFKDVLQGALEVRRAVRLRRYFIEKLGVSSDQIQIDCDHTTLKDKRGTYRLVKSLLVLPPDYATQADLRRQAAAFDDSIKAVRLDLGSRDTHIRENNFFNYLLPDVELGCGITNSPFSGTIPYLEGALGNSYIAFCAEGMYWPVSTTVRPTDKSYSVIQRDIACYCRGTLLDRAHTKVFVRAGWIRWEWYAKAYGRYVEKKEGSSFGIGILYKSLFLNASVEGLEHNRLGSDRVETNWSGRIQIGLHFTVHDRSKGIER